MQTLNDFSARDISGEDRKLSDYAGKVCLVVNVASECGLTPQYDGLQRLYTQYRDDNFEILAFPCNQFGAQEPGTEAEIEKYCRTQYAVTFPLFAKLEVKGDEAHPLYDWLSAEECGPDPAGEIAWNFAKFLLDGDGNVVARFAPTVEPCAADVIDRVDLALKSLTAREAADRG